MEQFHFITLSLQLRLESAPHLRIWKRYHYLLSWVYKLQINSKDQWIRKVAFPGIFSPSPLGPRVEHATYTRDLDIPEVHTVYYTLFKASYQLLLIFFCVTIALCTPPTKRRASSPPRCKIHLEKDYPWHPSYNRETSAQREEPQLVGPTTSNSLMRNLYPIISICSVQRNALLNIFFFTNLYSEIIPWASE